MRNLIVLFAVLSANFLFAQEKCASDIIHNNQLKNDPAYRAMKNNYHPPPPAGYRLVQAHRPMQRHAIARLSTKDFMSLLKCW